MLNLCMWLVSALCQLFQVFVLAAVIVVVALAIVVRMTCAVLATFVRRVCFQVYSLLVGIADHILYVGETVWIRDFSVLSFFCLDQVNVWYVILRINNNISICFVLIIMMIWLCDLHMTSTVISGIVSIPIDVYLALSKLNNFFARLYAFSVYLLVSCSLWRVLCVFVREPKWSFSLFTWNIVLLRVYLLSNTPLKQHFHFLFTFEIKTPRPKW